MRIVFLSNFYPPNQNGGYEQLCQETAAEFAQRGHDVAVLTSKTTGCSDLRVDGLVRVYRSIELEVTGGVARTAARLLTRGTGQDPANREEVRRVLETFDPDVVVVWGMWNVPRSVAAIAEQLLPGRVLYYLCDYWPSLASAYRQQLDSASTHVVSRLPKKLAAMLVSNRLRKELAPELRFDRPICVSHAVRELLVERGVPVAHALIIPNGIRLDQFASAARPESSTVRGERLRLVYAGRLSPEKGVDTAIRAVSQIVERQSRPVVSLDIVGGGPEGYARELKALVRKGGLEQVVTFAGNVPRATMPAVLASYDALIFPSVWPEPSARTVMEAMAVGLVVIGTTTGGTAEVLIDGETGLAFPPNDSSALAERIQLLGDDPELRASLVRTARRRVAERFTFARMADALEAQVESALASEANVTGAR